jgi:predicted CoA-binding protein
MNDEPPATKNPDQPPALPPSDRPAMASGPAPVPLGPGERPAIAPAGAPVALMGSGQAALSAGTQIAPDPQKGVIEAVLGAARTIAVVGASDKIGKPSHRVAFYLMHAGFEVYPVNPTLKELGGRPAFPDLRSIPVKIDIVDIFRRPEQVLSVVEEAIAVGARAVWMQEGIVNGEAAARALSAGLDVVMDRCMMKEHRKLKGEKPVPEAISGVLLR